MKTKRRITAKDKALLDDAERILDSGSPGLLAQRELILEVLRTLLDTKYPKQRIKLVLSPEQTTALEGKVYDKIAAVISNTYVELGDMAPLADDEALEMIRDLILDFDAGIIDRNRFRKIPRRKWWGKR